MSKKKKDDTELQRHRFGYYATTGVYFYSESEEDDSIAAQYDEYYRATEVDPLLKELRQLRAKGGK